VDARDKAALWVFPPASFRSCSCSNPTVGVTATCYDNSPWAQTLPGFGFDAQTLGHTIMCARECSPDQVVHETTHVPQQQQQDGVGSFIRDVWQWRFGLFGGGYCNIDYEK
jgi:hypothetical protein